MWSVTTAAARLGQSRGLILFQIVKVGVLRTGPLM